LVGPDASGVDIPAQSSLRRLRRLICVDAAPIGAPLAAILGLGSVLPGAESGLLAPLIRRLPPPCFRTDQRPAIEGGPA